MCKDENDDENKIEDFLEYDVSNIEWLRVCNSQIPYSELLDKNALGEYFKNENKKYCEQNGLCEICRNPLQERTEYKDGMISEKYWICKYGCN